MRLVVESAGDEHIEVGVAAFASGFDKIGTGNRAEFRPDENAGASFGLAFEIPAFGAHVIAGPGSERSERDLIFLVRLLYSSALQVFQDHLGKALLRAVFTVLLGHAGVD